MPLQKDWREFIESLNSESVDYLIVGAVAFAFHSNPRFTGDLDIFIRASPENAERLARVLRKFGFASVGLEASDLHQPDQIVQLGVRPNRIDLITSISGVTFDEAWMSRVPAEIDGLPVHFISRRLLIRNKRAVGRAQDLSDLEALES